MAGLAAVGKITASRQVEDHTSMESRYYLLPKRFNEIVRSHWGIENPVALATGRVFNEDQARNRKGHWMALLRKLALNLAVTSAI